MDKSNMSELRFEAPLAKFDTDEWNEFADENSPCSPCSISKMSEASSSISSDARTIKLGTVLCVDEDFENENFSGSLEDLVNSFDSKIVKCLKNFSEQSEAIAPVQNRTDQDLLVDSQTWWTLTGNYGNVYPIDWSRSGVVVGDEQGIMDSGVVDDRSEDGWKERDEEEEEAHVPLSADDVINELDDLLEDHHLNLQNRQHRLNFESRILSSDHLRLTKKFKEGRGNYDDSALKKQALGDLLKTRDELNRNILSQSEVLIRELDERDELEYEKELKNHFIWLLISVQKRRKELLLNKNILNTSTITTNDVSNDGIEDTNNNTNTQLIEYSYDTNNNNNNNNNATMTNTNDNITDNNKTSDDNKTTTTNALNKKAQAYLTTVIPYRKRQAPLSIDVLLIFIRILSAMNENSPVTPSLLTDYILNILCPAA